MLFALPNLFDIARHVLARQYRQEICNTQALNIIYTESPTSLFFTAADAVGNLLP
jgi:hypothetical protein